MAGAEIVQLYVKNFIGLENRPEKELKNFAKVFLEPGETKTISMELDFRSFAYFNEFISSYFNALLLNDNMECNGVSSNTAFISPSAFSSSAAFPFLSLSCLLFRSMQEKLKLFVWNWISAHSHILMKH